MLHGKSILKYVILCVTCIVTMPTQLFSMVYTGGSTPFIDNVYPRAQIIVCYEPIDPYRPIKPYRPINPSQPIIPYEPVNSYPITFPTGGTTPPFSKPPRWDNPILQCPDGTISHNCGPMTGGPTPPNKWPKPPKEGFWLPPVEFPTGQKCDEATGICELIYEKPLIPPIEGPPSSPMGEIVCTDVYREDGSDNCRIIPPAGPITPIECAQGYISNDNKTCVSTEMTPCAVSDTCTSGPSGGGGGGTGISEPALPAMLLTLLGLGFWVRRRR